jgi:hypothetical protein
MTNDVMKKPENEICNLDGFSGFTDEAEGEDQDQFASVRVIQGTRINFTNEATWVDIAKQQLPDNLELIVHDIARVVQKWGKDNMPNADPIILAPNQKWPDLKAMNEKCPKTEWRMRFNNLVGPYEAQYIVYMWDPVKMKKYSWPTSTKGGRVCVAEFVEKIQWMRATKKNQHIFAVVKLGSQMWSKQYNRRRPDLIGQYWIERDEDGALTPLTSTTPAIIGPTTTTPADSKTAAASIPTDPKKVVAEQLGMRTVTPPTAKEATGDEIPF